VKELVVEMLVGCAALRAMLSSWLRPDDCCLDDSFMADVGCGWPPESGGG